MNKMKKFFDFDVKSAEGEENTFWFTASTEARDRQGDIIVQQGWRTADFMKNPVILWAHNYYETPIGKALEIKITPENLSAKIQFVPETIDPFAGKVSKLVAQGYLKTVSVGFMVYKSEPLNADDLKQRPDMKYGQRLYGDLLEISIVPVPANPEALNENAFSEVVSRGITMQSDEIESPQLSYRDEKGSVDHRKLRACVAAALGARGGVDLKGANPLKCLNHLYRVAKENKIELPERHGMEVPKMQEVFKDVWHNELLDVLNKAQENSGDVYVKLIKGKTRSQLIVARDALNAILDLHEQQTSDEKNQEVTTASSDELKTIQDIVTNLSDIKARLT